MIPVSTVSKAHCPKELKVTWKESQDLLQNSYQQTPDSIGRFQIDRDLSGRRAQVYYDPLANESVVVHRGTQGLADWGTDLGMVFGYRGKRFQHAHDVQEKANKKYQSSHMTTLGHSLGGKLAEEAGAGTDVVTLNKAALPFQENKNKNQLDVKNRNDLVSALHFMQEGGHRPMLLENNDLLTPGNVLKAHAIV